MTPTYTATEVKAAHRQALGMLSRSYRGGPTARLILEEGDRLPLTAGILLGLAAGILGGYAQIGEGAPEDWLDGMAESIEAMTEGDE